MPRALTLVSWFKMQAEMQLKDILQSGVEITDRALERLLPPVTQVPASIHGAMRHSVFAGGKRLRPILVYEAARTLAKGELPQGIEDLGAAIEMLHTYSLIHDDLPALDNDDLRRGKPTCHVAFGEAIAILAGDALQTLAYQTLSTLGCSAPVTVEILRLISEATGTVEGMIGGQVLDLESERLKPTPELVEAIHRAKTGALLRASVRMGAIYAGASAAELAALSEYGEHAGLAFQIVDDVLDMEESSEALGKTAGKDEAQQKITFPAVYGLERSRQMAEDEREAAHAALSLFGDRAARLRQIADFIVKRKA